jgi:hypothetical protein
MYFLPAADLLSSRTMTSIVHRAVAKESFFAVTAVPTRSTTHA